VAHKRYWVTRPIRLFRRSEISQQGTTDCQIPIPPVGCSEYAALLHHCKARIHARTLYMKLRAHAPGLHIVICLWHFQGDVQQAATRLRLAGGHGFFTTIPQVLNHVASRTDFVGTGAANH
jgi:hypothetical protein